MVIISPHGFNISPNLPNPECSTELVWTVEAVNKMIQLAKKGMLEGTYGRNDTNSLRDGLKNTPGIINGRVLVIGPKSS
jgi:hypothetical protein